VSVGADPQVAVPIAVEPVRVSSRLIGDLVENGRSLAPQLLTGDIRAFAAPAALDPFDQRFAAGVEPAHREGHAGQRVGVGTDRGGVVHPAGHYEAAGARVAEGGPHGGEVGRLEPVVVRIVGGRRVAEPDLG